MPNTYAVACHQVVNHDAIEPTSVILKWKNGNDDWIVFHGEKQEKDYVYCSNCGWEGSEQLLLAGPDAPYCPVCNTSEHIGNVKPGPLKKTFDSFNIYTSTYDPRCFGYHDYDGKWVPNKLVQDLNANCAKMRARLAELELEAQVRKGFEHE